MEQTRPTLIVKPAVTTIEVDGVVYNAEPSKTGDWHFTHEFDYGPRFRQGTMNAQLNIIHSGYINEDNKDLTGEQRRYAGRIVKTSKDLWVTGNTALYGGDANSDLVFAQDFPLVKNGRIVMSQRDLEAQLSSKEVKGVIFSADGRVRAMKRESFRAGDYSAGQMAQSNQPIFITGNESAPEKMADITGIIGKLGYLSIPLPQAVTVPNLTEEGRGIICLGGDTWGELNQGRRSFGVQTLVRSEIVNAINYLAQIF